MTIHENKNYVVQVHPEGKGYDIVNKSTGVVEANKEHLPGALMTAETYDTFLVKHEGGKADEATVVTLRQVNPQ
jgi:hypothetical protein